MALDPVTAGIDLISKVIGKAADKYLPPSMSEAEREQFKLEARKLAMQESQTLVDFVKATEPEAQYTGRIVNGLRASVRPGIAWLSFLTYQGMLIWLTIEGRVRVTEVVGQAGGCSTP